MNDDPRFDRDVRDLLHDGPDTFPEPSRARVLARVHRTGQQRAWRIRGLARPVKPLGFALAGAAVALVVLAVGLYPPRHGVGSAGVLDNQRHSPSASALRLEAHWTVGARAIAVAEDGLWYASSDGRTVRKFDPRAGRDTLSVEVDRWPDWLVLTDGSLWVSHEAVPGTPRQRLFRLDPATGAVLATIDTGPGAIAAGDGSIWLAGPAALLRIEPDRNRVAERIPTQGTTGNHGITVGDESVWLASSLGVRRLDSATGRVIATVPVSAWKLVAGGGSVWAIAGNSIVGIDPETNDVETRIEGLPLPEELAWGSGTVWAVGPQAISEPAFLIRVDPSTGRIVSRTPIGSGAEGLAVRSGSVWTSTMAEPRLSRFALPP